MTTTPISVWKELPGPLVSFVLTFVIASTEDVAAMRTLGEVGRNAVSSSSHFIKCMSDDRAGEICGAFVRDLLYGSHMLHDDYGIVVGEAFVVVANEQQDRHRVRHNIEPFLGAYWNRFHFIGLPKCVSSEKCYRNTSHPEQVPDLTEFQDMTQDEKLVRVAELSKCLKYKSNSLDLEKEYVKIKALGGLEPVEKPSSCSGKNEASVAEKLSQHERFEYPVQMGLDVPKDAPCIVGNNSYPAADNCIFLRTKSDADSLALIDAPFYPTSDNKGAVYRAYVLSETDTSYYVLVNIVLQANTMYLYDLRFDPENVRIESFHWLQFLDRHQLKPVKEGVTIVDGLLSKSFKEKLSEQIDKLAEKQEKDGMIDYHPHSNGIVRDLVHPGLYSFVKDVTPLRASVDDVAPCTFDEDDDDDDEDDVTEQESSRDYWGRKYERSTYQWLPTYFSISQSGECAIEDYINNLSPREDPIIIAPLYKTLATLFETFLPFVESVFSYVKGIRPGVRTEEDDELSWNDDELQPVELKHYPLRDKKLQVITKIVDYELRPGQSYKGVWHVEGMSHEEIVLTALYILDRDEDIQGGDLLFKRAFLQREAEYIFASVDQCRPEEMEDIISDGLALLGKAETLDGRLIVFPNSHVHKVSEMVAKNLQTDDDKVLKRRIVVFFLVNPERRIVSTREVAPQQKYAGGSMDLDDALKHRLELMRERKHHKQDWNVREIELCEH